MATCNGNGDDHCCYLGEAGTCRHLEENTVPGRRWACGLYRELGSWEAVHADDRYPAVRRHLTAAGITVGCGDWPQNVPALEAGVRAGTINPSAACCWGDEWRP